MFFLLFHSTRIRRRWLAFQIPIVHFFSSSYVHHRTIIIHIPVTDRSDMHSVSGTCDYINKFNCFEAKNWISDFNWIVLLWSGVC